MDSGLYEKQVRCPVCLKPIIVTKVRSKSIKVASRDTDFCIYYEGINPLFYLVWVCEKCGYAAMEDKFEQLGPNDADIIKKNISTHWTERSFKGERSIEKALETFKLALYNLQVRKAKSSEMAKICLRLAWLYRIKKDDKEVGFLQHALNLYLDAYEREEFPIDKLDEYTCMYIIAELYRRVENLDEAVKWFSRLMSSQEARKNPSLIESARDQFQLVKEQMQKKVGG